MTKRLFPFLLAPLALIIVIASSRLRPAESTEPAFEPASPAANASDAADAANEPAPETPTPLFDKTLVASHATSLVALGATEFNGSELKFGAVQATTAAYVRHFVTYKSGDLTISGTFAIPKGKGPFPLVIQNHGYIDPKIYTNGRGLRREQDYMASRGFTVLHTDYRGHAQSDSDGNSELTMRLGYAEDSINAVYAVRAAIAAGEPKLSGVSAERVGMIGHSMGGGVTMQTITAVPDLLAAAVLYAPVSGDARDNFDRWTRSRPEVAAQVLERYGAPEETPRFWDGVSPIKHLDAVRTPVLLHHGTADDSCPHEWAVELEAAFAEAGRADLLKFYSYPGQPHEFTTSWPLMMQRTVEFFDGLLRTS